MIIKTLRTIKNLINVPLREYKKFKIKRLPQKNSAERGSVEWLQNVEKRYGGFIEKVPLNKISDHDERNFEEEKLLGMQGGDRMLFHGYGKWYSKYLNRYLDRDSSELLIVEVGILTGTGLAIWSELFPKSKLFGFDIDLKNFKDNESNLRDLGAFKENNPTTIEFDQLNPNFSDIKDSFEEHPIDILIDDGLHNTESVVNTAKAFLPYMSKNSVYFIEDYKFSKKNIESLANEHNFKTDYQGLFTILYR